MKNRIVMVLALMALVEASLMAAVIAPIVQIDEDSFFTLYQNGSLTLANRSMYSEVETVYPDYPASMNEVVLFKKESNGQYTAAVYTQGENVSTNSAVLTKELSYFFSNYGRVFALGCKWSLQLDEDKGIITATSTDNLIYRYNGTASIQLKTENNCLQLNAEVSPGDAKDKTVLWSSSDETIAVVDSEGRVTGKRNGSATITAKSQSFPTVTDSVSVVASHQPIEVTILLGTRNPANILYSKGQPVEGGRLVVSTEGTKNFKTFLSELELQWKNGTDPLQNINAFTIYQEQEHTCDYFTIFTEPSSDPKVLELVDRSMVIYVAELN